MSATCSMTMHKRAAQQGRPPGVRSYSEQGDAAGHHSTVPGQQESPDAHQQRTQPEGASGYHIMHPNEERRNKVQAIAIKEMEDLEQNKEAHRPGPINLGPRRLGGNVSEYEAREQQQLGLCQSKYQQQMKREEYKRKQKEAEDAEIQKMKAVQREKANQLEEKRRQQEKERRDTFEDDRHHINNAFLERLGTRFHVPSWLFRNWRPPFLFLIQAVIRNLALQI
ncbi:epithelial-stromal interaction protein 1-like [Lissotriton helveticus]